jgi:hypothetical protein
MIVSVLKFDVKTRGITRSAVTRIIRSSSYLPSHMCYHRSNGKFCSRSPRCLGSADVRVRFLLRTSVNGRRRDGCQTDTRDVLNGDPHGYGLCELRACHHLCKARGNTKTVDVLMQDPIGSGRDAPRFSSWHTVRAFPSRLVGAETGDQ